MWFSKQKHSLPYCECYSRENFCRRHVHCIGYRTSSDLISPDLIFAEHTSSSHGTVADLEGVPWVPWNPPFCRQREDQPAHGHCVFSRNMSHLILKQSVSVSYSSFWANSNYQLYSVIARLAGCNLVASYTKYYFVQFWFVCKYVQLEMQCSKKKIVSMVTLKL